MPKYDSFKEFEQAEINNVKGVIPNVMKELKEPLDDYNKSQSVVSDSLNNIEQTNNLNNTLTGQGNSQNKQRVLTKEMPGTHGVVPSSSVSTDNVNSNIPNSVYYSNNSTSSNNSMGGYSNTAILLSMAVLIALVFLVSTAIIMYVGLR